MHRLINSFIVCAVQIKIERLKNGIFQFFPIKMGKRICRIAAGDYRNVYMNILMRKSFHNNQGDRAFLIVE